MIVIGHRGAAGHAPENTLASIAVAVGQGVDSVEIDVRALDGHLIVLHDDVLERTTNGRGHYKSVSLAALRALDAGGGEQVPLLGEVVELIAGRCGLNVEVKEPGIAREVVAELEASTGDRGGWRSRVLLSSFDVGTTRDLAAMRGEMRLGVLYDDPFPAALGRAIELGAYSIHMPLRGVTEEAVARAHDQGLAVFSYTVNTRPEIERCAAARVDGVFSDFPDRVIAFNRGVEE